MGSLYREVDEGLLAFDGMGFQLATTDDLRAKILLLVFVARNAALSLDHLLVAFFVIGRPQPFKAGLSRIEKLDGAGRYLGPVHIR